MILKCIFPGEYNYIFVHTVSKYIKQKLSEIQGEIDKRTIIDFNTSFLVTDTSKGKKG